MEVKIGKDLQNVRVSKLNGKGDEDDLEAWLNDMKPILK